MATTKSFGIAGVSSDVQFGKGGGRFVWDTSSFKVTGTDGSTLVNLLAAEPTLNDHVATKAYVDGVAQGLDIKYSVRVATTSTDGNIDLTIGGLLTIDGVTLSAGDRVLVKDQTDARQNGIYVAAAGAWSRAEDADNTPGAELTPGSFTFVEEGTVNAGEGFVATGTATGTNGEYDFATDDINWTQFSSAGSYYGTDGVSISGTQVSLDFSGLGSTALDANNDVVAFYDTSAGTHAKRSIADFFTDAAAYRDTDATQGILTANGSGTFTKRSVVAGTGAEDGLSVTNGDGSGGNITVGLDITGLTGTTAADAADEIVFYDASGAVNLKRTIGSLFTDVNAYRDTDLTQGFLTADGSGNYAKRSIVASTTAGLQGVNVANGDGSANPEIGLNINGLSAKGAVASTDKFVIYDGTNNVTVDMTDITAGLDLTDVTAGSTNLSATDELLVWVGGSLVKMSGQELADGVASQVSLDNTQIISSDSLTSVSTESTDNNGVANKVVVSAADATNSASRSVAVFETLDGVDTSDRHITFRNGNTGTTSLTEVQMAAEGTATDIDIRLVPKGNGQVYIGDTGDGIIQADDDYALTLKGGDSNTGDAGDLILEGGAGASTNASGDVILRGGTGGAAEGTVHIQDSASNDIMVFQAGSGTVDSYFTVSNAEAATGQLTLAASSGTASDVDILLSPKGTGKLYYGGTTADDEVATVGDVNSSIASNTDPLTRRATVSADGASTSFNIGSALANVAGKTYAVSRVIINVSTAFNTDSGATVQDTVGVTTLAANSEFDLTATGVYVIDVPFTDVAGNAQFALTGFSSAPTTGAATITVEYKVL